VVTACAGCNLMKGGHLAERVGMHPRQHPHKPSVVELQNNGRLFPPNYLHHSWADYLYWDIVLEP
jgi:5-methylcytosine-specific restriction endonuclease McrA